MADNKNNSQSGSKGSTSGQDREFESQGQDKGYGKSETGQQGSSAHSSKMEDDEMNTAGGRKGQFSDSERGKEDQWSPGSTQPSDQ